MSQKMQTQFRYYDLPPDSLFLALFGDSWIREYGNDLDALHFHNYLEIGVCLEGDGHMDFGDHKLPYTSGNITVIPPKYPHHTNSQPGETCHWAYLFIDIDGVLKHVFPDRTYRREQVAARIGQGALVLCKNQHPHIADLVRALLDEQQQKHEFYQESTRAKLCSLMLYLARICPPIGGQMQATSRTDAVSIAIDHVAKHYAEKLTIRDLADSCRLSETHFRRLFTHAMGISPQGYINRIRVDAACKLLHTTDLSVGEIATRCGFINAATFNRNFQRMMNMSPSAFRRDKQYYARQREGRVLAYEGWR